MLARLLLISVIAIFPCLQVVQAQAPALNQDPILYYVLDGSGSMWGRAEGEIKIQIAKNVLSDLIENMPTNIQSGLTVYGHRRKGDCQDIQEVIPPGKLDKALALEEIKRISPKGKTPISESITRVVNRIKDIEAKSTVVLVSDGLETCGDDPCKVTEALKQTGVEFVLHVVGFGLSDSDSKQLSCIAKAGGGFYLPASNATELLTALRKVEKSVIESKPVVLEPVVKPVVKKEEPVVVPEQKLASKSTSIKIKAKGPGRVALIGPDWMKTPYYWLLIDPETGEEKAKFTSLSEQLVAPGEYQLVWRQDEHKGGNEVHLGEVITVESRKRTEINLRTSVQFKIPSWAKEPYYWELRNPIFGDLNVKLASLEPQFIPPGTYELYWRQSEHRAEPTSLGVITIEPDEKNEVNLNTALNPLPADWVPSDIHFWGLTKPGEKEFVAKYSRSFEPQLINAGEYDVHYRQTEHGSTTSLLGTVKIEAGKVNDIPLNSGVKFNAVGEMEKPYRIYFRDLEASNSKARVVRLNKSWGPMVLKPGKYQIDYHQDEHGSEKMTIVDSFDLVSGSLVEIDL